MLRQIHPLLQVQDIDASLAFYCDKLGFRGGIADDGFAIVRRDDCTIYLAQKTKDANVTNKAARAALDGWCSYDLFVYCAQKSLDSLYREFTENGVEWLDCFVKGPVTRPYGMRDFSVFDPDGYDLVFAESDEG